MSTDTAQRIVDNVEKVIIGKRKAVKFLLVGLLTNGHVLLEDVPGVGKTMLALALAKSIQGVFRRIQFTPDLLPSDVTGGFVFSPKTQEFSLRKGPVFANIVLADEVNRTTPRTQSALLECMQEYRVTLDGTTHPLPLPFMVIATQNPVEYQGTYPLPEAQIDRFFMKLNLGYPSLQEEARMLQDQKKAHPVESLAAVCSLEEVIALQERVKAVELSDHIVRYIVQIIGRTRTHEEIKRGASPRASIALMRAVSAWALLEGRDYVIPDDVAMVLPGILAHRITLHPKAFVAGKNAEGLVEQILKTTPIP